MSRVEISVNQKRASMREAALLAILASGENLGGTHRRLVRSRELGRP